VSTERATPEAIRFHVDPLCPWCYQTMRWALRLQSLGEVAVQWGVFSLAIVNRGDQGRADGEAASVRALRTAVAVRDELGNEAMGRFFATLGAALHENKRDIQDPATIQLALSDAGLDSAMADRAVSDAATWQSVIAEHDELVARHQAFGVPTIVLDGGAGPAIFGPVISELPEDHDAVEMWHHVRWLVRNRSFSELKRERPRRPSFVSAGAPPGQSRPHAA
jgi:predicted DsbA family dithiol-disulfide isomerase